jgi:transposase
MGVKDAVRLAAVREAHEGRMSIREGMRRTGLSRSQFLRYKRRFKTLGPPGLLHAGRGRPSPRRLDETVRAAVQRLLEDPVSLNDRHIQDLLAEDGITVSADSVWRIRRAQGMAPKQRRRPRRYRLRRERRAQEGAMVLTDGSPFRWLGPQQPECTLVGAMDDATGRVLALTFRDEEDLHGFAVVLRDTLRQFGVPWTLYGDRASILVRNDRYWTLDEQLAGRQQPSHFGRMLEALGIRYIAALSPQAKGRIERLWRTLQDRLAAELALRRCDTRAKAEAFLPGFITRYNQRFARPPRDTQSVWRKTPRDLDRLLACRYPRVVRLDNTVSLANHPLQLPPGPGQRSYAQCRVEVLELLDGRRMVLYQGRLLLECPAPSGTFQLVSRASARPRYRSAPPTPRVRPVPHAVHPRGTTAYLNSIKPAPSHPFRRSYATIPIRRKETPKGVSLPRRR